jgi:hypothetical protein
MSDNPYMGLTPEEAMNNLSSNPFITMLAALYSGTKTPKKKKVAPSMVSQKGPIAAKTPKKIARTRAEIMKQID